MSAFNPNGELHATNLPAAFLEMSQKLSAAELAVPADTRPNNITIAVDVEGGAATVTASIPIAVTADASGRLVVSASDYL